MCGIAGISFRSDVMTEAEASALVAGMLEDLAHRGPDGVGLASTPNAVIGMRHLRVRSRPDVDLPFRSDRLESSLTFNGEVYRAYRARGGWLLPSGGEEEAEAVAEDPPGWRVDGMYALGALRWADSRVTLARDPFGIKPLFLARRPGVIAFASEARPLLRLLPRRRVRREAVAQFLVAGRVLDGGAFVEGIEAVAPGARLTLRAGEIAARQPLHRPSRAPAPHGPAALRRGIREALELTLDSRRPVGLAVSGGLDSSIVAYELNAMGVDGLSTVSILAEGTHDGLADLAQLGLGEGPWSGWSHRSKVVRAAEFGDLLRMTVSAYGEPTSMSSAPLYLALAEAAREEGVVVLLLGEGADELFMGYSSYLSLLRPPSSPLAFYLGTDRCRLASEVLGANSVQEAVTAWAAALEPLGTYPLVESVRQFELEHSLEPLLRRADHLLMAFAIEGRTPFLHGAVPALAAALPPERLLVAGETKAALRRVYSTVLPQGRAGVSKRPFRAPLRPWLAGPLRPLIEEAVGANQTALRLCGVDPARTAELTRQLDRGHTEAANLAFCLLTLALWLEWLPSA